MHMRHLSKKATFILSAVLIVGGLGMLTWSAFLLFGQPGGAPASDQTTARAPSSQTEPSSIRSSPDDISNYKVASSLPKFITIQSIGVTKTRIKHLGLADNNRIAEPDNLYDTAWYTGSSKPGEQGAMFIFGHVSSWEATGIFYNLKNLKPGDRITIQRGDDQLFLYEVSSTKTYPADQVDMNAVLAPVNPKVPGLNLMTCSGKVIKGTNDFSERLVVFASLVKN
ncbi:MAG: Sortase family enzyme [Candidatus Saccharibacteria bacterium]|nr:Sortase family enzyme [Candidatus Saccharibacteria bacterium]